MSIISTTRVGTFSNTDPVNIEHAAKVAKSIVESNPRWGFAVVDRIAPSLTQDGIYAVLATVSKADAPTDVECAVWTLDVRGASLTGGRYSESCVDAIAAFETRCWNIGSAI